MFVWFIVAMVFGSTWDSQTHSEVARILWGNMLQDNAKFVSEFSFIKW